MRHTILTGAALLLAVTACGEQVARPDVPEGAPEAEQSRQEEGGDPGATGTPGDQATAEEGEEPYVFNHYGDEDGFPDLRPTDYVATEFTTFSGMEWSEWSNEVARGEGELSGTWCMDVGCQDDPYDVEVELGDPVEADGATYFSTYTITDHDDDMSAETRQAMQEADGGRLSVPSSG